MTFIDQRLPEKYAYGAISSDDWRTEIVESLGRVEARNSPAANPRRSWDLSTNAMTQTTRDEIHEWFLAMRGPLHSFAFRDPADYICVRNQIATGDGADSTFQLVKVYSIAGASYSRELTKPITATVRVWVSNVEQMSGWTVSRTTGIITFSAPPANAAAIEASCEFDVPVRFNQSKLSWKALDNSNGVVWATDELNLIEVLGE